MLLQQPESHWSTRSGWKLTWLKSSHKGACSHLPSQGWLCWAAHPSSPQQPPVVPAPVTITSNPWQGADVGSPPRMIPYILFPFRCPMWSSSHSPRSGTGPYTPPLYHWQTLAALAGITCNKLLVSCCPGPPHGCTTPVPRQGSWNQHRDRGICPLQLPESSSNWSWNCTLGPTFHWQELTSAGRAADQSCGVLPPTTLSSSHPLCLAQASAVVTSSKDWPGWKLTWVEETLFFNQINFISTKNHRIPAGFGLKGP